MRNLRFAAVAAVSAFLTSPVNAATEVASPASFSKTWMDQLKLPNGLGVNNNEFFGRYSEAYARGEKPIIGYSDTITAFQKKMNAQGKRVIIKFPEHESLNATASYYLQSAAERIQIDFTRAAVPQLTTCPTNAAELARTDANATVAHANGFTPSSDKVTVSSITVNNGRMSAVKINAGNELAAVTFPEASEVIVYADGSFEARAIGEIHVSEQVELKKDKSNLKSYFSCIKQSEPQTACVIINGTPTDPTGRRGTASVMITNNTNRCEKPDFGNITLVTSPLELEPVNVPRFYKEGDGYRFLGFIPGGWGPGFGFDGGCCFVWGGGGSRPPIVTPPPVIPEPSSWALMIAGFGLVGTALRRRQREAAPSL